MLAIKWRDDFPQWPKTIRRNVQSLPYGFDELMSAEDYQAYLVLHEQDFLNWKEAQELEQAQASIVSNGVAKFSQIRNKWQELADKFAFENSAMGISQVEGKTKEVADAFERVVYYLNVNAPLEAVKELDLIPRGEVFLTEERITTLKNNFAAFLASL